MHAPFFERLPQPRRAMLQKLPPIPQKRSTDFAPVTRKLRRITFPTTGGAAVFTIAGGASFFGAVAAIFSAATSASGIVCGTSSNSNSRGSTTAPRHGDSAKREMDFVAARNDQKTLRTWTLNYRTRSLRSSRSAVILWGKARTTEVLHVAMRVKEGSRDEKATKIYVTPKAAELASRFLVSSTPQVDRCSNSAFPVISAPKCTPASRHESASRSTGRAPGACSQATAPSQ